MNGLQKPKCKAHKKDGTPCGRWPIKGGTVCPKHGGSAPQVRRKAVERIIAASDLAAGRLIEFMNDKRVPYSVRLAATRDLLDRGIGPAAQTFKFGGAEETPYDALLREIIEDPNLIIDAPRSALPAPALGWGQEWLPEEDGDTIIGEVVPESEPEPTPAGPAATRGKRRVSVKVPGHIRTGLRLDPSPDRATFAP